MTNHPDSKVCVFNFHISRRNRKGAAYTERILLETLDKISESKPAHGDSKENL